MRSPVEAGAAAVAEFEATATGAAGLWTCAGAGAGTAATGAFAGAGAWDLAGAGAGTGAATAAPEPAASITPTTVWIGTVWPSPTLISFSTPAEGDGISASTLSVEISNSGSSRSTLSPGFLSHLVIVPSKMLSPIWGITMSTAIVVLLFSLSPNTAPILLRRQKPFSRWAGNALLTWVRTAREYREMSRARAARRD